MLFEAFISYAIGLLTNASTEAIMQRREAKLNEIIQDEEMLKKALESGRSVRDGAPGEALAVLDRCKVLSMVIACSP